MENNKLQPYLDIINHFGVRRQMKKCNEEMYEFLEAVDNYEDVLAEMEDPMHYDEEYGQIFRNHVVEEMGDVLLLLTEFIALYDIDKFELDRYMDYKLNNVLNYINDILEKGEYKHERF